jgi:hypothetical protein
MCNRLHPIVERIYISLDRRDQATRAFNVQFCWKSWAAQSASHRSTAFARRILDRPHSTVGRRDYTGGMSSRQSARLADKPRHSSNEKVLSSNRTSDSDLLAHHREKTSLPQYSDIDESHGEGSRSKRPRQTKKRRIESKVPEQPDAASLKITGVPRKIRKHANMKWEEPIRAQELLHHSGNQDDSIDLNEPPNTPIWTDFGLKERSRPSELNNASESRDSASSYASYRRKESLECLKFVNHVLIEHFRSEHSTDCVVPSSQLHERDEALLFVDSKDRQSPESPCEERRTEHTDAAQNSSDFEDVPLPDVSTGTEIEQQEPR